MKKIILVALLGIFLTSCGNSDDVIISKEEYDILKEIKISKPEYPKKIKFYDGEGIVRNASIIIIDSCEYIERELYSTSAVLLHKGNCCFCQRRLEEIRRNSKD